MSNKFIIVQAMGESPTQFPTIRGTPYLNSYFRYPCQLAFHVINISVILVTNKL